MQSLQFFMNTIICELINTRFLQFIRMPKDKSLVTMDVLLPHLSSIKDYFVQKCLKYIVIFETNTAFKNVMYIKDIFCSCQRNIHGLLCCLVTIQFIGGRRDIISNTPSYRVYTTFESFPQARLPKQSVPTEFTLQQISPGRRNKGKFLKSLWKVSNK